MKFDHLVAVVTNPLAVGGVLKATRTRDPLPVRGGVPKQVKVMFRPDHHPTSAWRHQAHPCSLGSVGKLGRDASTKQYLVLNHNHIHIHTPTATATTTVRAA
eukprot:319122-Rhodomonas_salina.1